MIPRHHLDPATVLSHAAGALPPDLSVIVATHLEVCPVCREALVCAEGVGGLLIEQQHAQPALSARAQQLRTAMFERLDATPPAPLPASRPASRDLDRIPAPLQPYFGASYRALKWRWMGPGMHFIRVIGPGGGTLLMLRIGPGKRMPVHGHSGNEVTQILSGAYDDALGHFAACDVADLDDSIEHQPVTAAGVPCICVSALDAPLRFRGWFARRMQRVFGI